MTAYGDRMTGWFEADGEVLVPGPHAVAPWRDDMLHGRFLPGIAAREAEQLDPDPSFVPTRLTIDMFKSPPMAPIASTTTVVRDGGRVRVVDVRSSSEDAEISRTRILLLRSDAAGLAAVWEPEPWDAPHPDTLDPPSEFGGPDSPWQFRVEPGRRMGAMGRKRMWLRDTWPLVAGESLSPFVRVAMVADFASPLANSGPDGLDLINADITLYLARLPRSEWLGFEVLTRDHDGGRSVAACSLHDLDGRIGFSSVSAVAY